MSDKKPNQHVAGRNSQKQAQRFWSQETQPCFVLYAQREINILTEIQNKPGLTICASGPKLSLCVR